MFLNKYLLSIDVISASDSRVSRVRIMCVAALCPRIVAHRSHAITLLAPCPTRYFVCYSHAVCASSSFLHAFVPRVWFACCSCASSHVTCTWSHVVVSTVRVLLRVFHSAVSCASSRVVRECRTYWSHTLPRVLFRVPPA
jgi:hypothetical protein